MLNPLLNSRGIADILIIRIIITSEKGEFNYGLSYRT